MNTYGEADAMGMASDIFTEKVMNDAIKDKTEMV